MDKKVDIIIPVYKPDERFLILLERLYRQSVMPNRIILINTEKAIWDKLDMEKRIEKTGVLKKCVIRHIKKSEFDHGKSRNFGVSLSESDYFICMTQDALPYNRYLIENLLKHLDENVKLVYARQIPYPAADIIERFTRIYNYPANSFVKSAGQVKKYGVKLYFASNVCAAYERKFFDSVGGFDEGLILNEDMLFAKKLMDGEKAVRYEAKAKVLHSHSYSGIEQMKRNFDIGSSQAAHPEVFAEFSGEGEGIRLVKNTAYYLLKKGAAYKIPELIYISGCKYIGYRLGKMYKKLPAFIIGAISANKSYWER